MDRFKELAAFVGAMQHGSLSAAAEAEGVSPAVISRRLDALEARLGVKLLVRTTRSLSLSFEGAAFFEEGLRILNELSNAEAAVSLGGVKASGHIRISAPAGFGRRFVVPAIRRFLDEHTEVTISLDLSDRVVDLVNEGFDCAVRLGVPEDSSLVSLRMGEYRRLVVGSPAYLDAKGVPRGLDDLALHSCLTLRQQRGWVFADPDRPGQSRLVRVSGRFECNDGSVLREWALDGCGLAWRSEWEVGDDLRAGRLRSVLDSLAAPPVGVYAVFPQRRHLPLRVRMLLDWLKHSFAAA